MRNLFNWQDLSIKLKIIIPFMVINLAVAVVAGYIARNWVAQRIEGELNQRIEGDYSQVIGHFEDEMENLERSTRAVAETPEVEETVLSKDYEFLRKNLIPKKGVYGFDFISVLDNQGYVILNINTPFRSSENLSNLDIVKRGFLEMTKASVIEFPEPYLVAVSPIHYSEGVSGLVFTGIKIDQQLLENISQQGMYISVFREGDSPIASFEQEEKVQQQLFPENVVCTGAMVKDIRLNRIPYRFYCSPFILDEKQIGVLSVGIQTREVITAKNQITTDVIILNVFLLVFIGSIGFWIAGTVISPAKRLFSASEKVAKGDFDIEVPIYGNDEIGALTKSFNLMVKSLKTQSESLTKHLLELTVLYDVSRMLGTTFDVSALLTSITESALKVFNADIVCTLLIEGGSGKISAGTCRRGPNTDAHVINVMEEKLSWLVKEKKGSVLIYEKNKTFNLPKGIISAMGAPIVIDGKVEGVITVGASKERYDKEDERLLATLAHQAGIAVQNASLFESLQETYLGIVKALAAAIDAKDPYTSGHSERVAQYALKIAQKLDFDEKDKKALEMAAYLHDIGKIGIKDEVLLKPAKLKPGEMEHVKQHPQIGANILEPVSFPWEIISTVQYHHEMFNGEGYPSGIKEDKIPIGARILALADSYEAMTAERPYKKHKKTKKEAIVELKRCSGTQFDPELVDVFIEVLTSEKS